MSKKRPKITRELLDSALGEKIPDVLGPGLKLLFCGINPGLYSGAVGHHFAHPSNRFWRVLHAAGYTDRRLTGFEDRELLEHGYGLTNFVERATARGSDLTAAELVSGGEQLIAKVQRYQPAVVAFLGIGAYRKAFGVRNVSVGEQQRKIADAVVWVLPNPSGLNAHYSFERLVQLYAAARECADALLAAR